MQMKHVSFYMVLLGLVLIAPVSFGEQWPLKVSDGPYVSKDSGALAIKCVVDNKVIQNQLEITPDKVPSISCYQDVNLHQINFKEQAILSYETDQPIAATSDFHGQYELMFSLLKAGGVINETGDWSFGKGHFVITGDIFDRGDKVTEILWFLYKLEQQAEQAGGQLHLLLGNHEVMVLNGDLRYLHPKYKQVEKIFEQPLDSLFKPNTVLGDWLRSKPVLVKINDMLFAHGGFHPELAKNNVNLQTINSVFKQHLVENELSKPREGFAKYLHKRNGPIWYRGYFKDDGATSKEIDLLLKHFDIKHLVVGHTSQEEVLTKHQGRVIAIDSSIKKGRYGELLIVDNQGKWRITPSGKRIALQN